MSLPDGNPSQNDGWWISRNKKNLGPFNRDVIASGLRSGKILPTDFIWVPDPGEWKGPQDVHSILNASTKTTIEPVVAVESLQVMKSDFLDRLPNGSKPQNLNVNDKSEKLDSKNLLTGRIKFLDAKNRSWGFITPDGGGEEIHYSTREIAGSYSDAFLENSEITYELGFDSKGKATAKNIIIKKLAIEASRKFRDAAVATSKESRDYSHVNKRLTDWAHIPFERAHRYDDETYDSVLHCLKEVSLREKWHFGVDEDSKDLSLLRRYILYTFDRLRNQDKISYAEQDGKKWAVFNTGLVDKVYDPIYMLFVENAPGKQRAWRLDNICIEGKRGPGKRLASLFSPCPPAAKYLDAATELIIPPGADILIDDEHVIEDALEDDRFPSQFLQRYAPRSLEWSDASFNSSSSRPEFLRRYRKALVEDLVRYREIKNRILDAIELAKKRTFWNYKTAIPSYYPKHNQVDLLLPLCLDDKNELLVTVALVVSRNRSGSYQGRTVYPLEWAYERARVVCRPDSDWLIPESIAPRAKISAEEPVELQIEQQEDDI